MASTRQEKEFIETVIPDLVASKSSSRLEGNTMVMRRAWLHRNGKSTWMFEPSPLYGELVHVTRNGTVYAILEGHKQGKPFWVARLCGGAWCTFERELRARSIEFEDAGDYVFPSA